MTTLELCLIALSATLWLLGGFITSTALVAIMRQPQYRVLVMLIWPAAVLYAILKPAQ